MKLVIKNFVISPIDDPDRLVLNMNRSLKSIKISRDLIALWGDSLLSTRSITGIVKETNRILKVKGLKIKHGDKNRFWYGLVTYDLYKI